MASTEVVYLVISPELQAGTDEDGVELRDAYGQYLNSEVLSNLSTHLSHLLCAQKADITQSYPTLFSDSPSRTTVLEHDINGDEAVPIKQQVF